MTAKSSYITIGGMKREIVKNAKKKVKIEKPKTSMCDCPMKDRKDLGANKLGERILYCKLHGTFLIEMR